MSRIGKTLVMAAVMALAAQSVADLPSDRGTRSKHGKRRTKAQTLNEINKRRNKKKFSKKWSKK